MITLVRAITVNGLESTLIDVEVDMNQGMPAFTIVGLPDQGVQESKERIRSALKSSGAKISPMRITINLAPAHIKKSGPNFDLAIAVGILLNQGCINHSFFFDDAVFLGELSLDGSLRHVSGILPATIGAMQKGKKRIFLPFENIAEAALIPNIDIIPIKNLKELILILNGELPCIPQTAVSLQEYKGNIHLKQYDFSDIIGQSHAKRALEIAAAGGHNVLMEGPPGSGKTLLAKAFGSILPDMTLEEVLEVSKIYSISGLLSSEYPLVLERPFRSVHHTASSVSLIGGGRNARPGEISLSHKGVLFLDEILEFPKQVLEVLRQPLEDGEITISRVNASLKYPAHFALLAAMNPCPCGYLSDSEKICTCSQVQIQNYRSRLSGPLQDRIDIFLDVPKVPMKDFQNGKVEKAETSEIIKMRVEAARKIQQARFEGTSLSSNAEMKSKDIKKFCNLEDEAENLLMQAIETLKLSARSYYRIIKLSQTLADLSQANIISSEHVLEALSYRKKEE